MALYYHTELMEQKVDHVHSPTLDHILI